MEDYIDRIGKIIELEGISPNKLETTVGTSKNVFAKPLKFKTDIQTKWIVKLSEKFPQYNFHWLITGEGEMLKQKTFETKTPNSVPIEENLKKEIIERLEFWHKESIKKDAKIEELLSKIKQLEDEKKEYHGYGIVAEPPAELKKHL